MDSQIGLPSKTYDKQNTMHGDHGDGVDDSVQCPTCKGDGFIKSFHPRPSSSYSGALAQYKDIELFSESSDTAIPSLRSLLKAKLSSLPATHKNNITTTSVDAKGSAEGASVTSKSEVVDKLVTESVRRAVSKLLRPEWEVNKQGLEECLSIGENYPDEVELHMNQIYRTMRLLLTNYRQRDALFVCQIARKFFARFRSTCRPEFDLLVITLLTRTVDSSFQVRCYVNDALDKMVTYMPTFNALRPLVCKGCRHNNPLVRTSSVRLLSDMVSLRTSSALLTQPHLRESCQKIIECGALLLVDNCLGTRAGAKNLFSKLVSHEDFEEMYKCCNINAKLKKRIDRTIYALKGQNCSEK